METSLNFDRTSLETLCSVLNAFIIDNKDFNKKIYKEYTGKDNGQVLENLRYLSTKEFGKAVKFIIPSIPEFNTDDDLIYSADS